jgi:hypothetical protein
MGRYNWFCKDAVQGAAQRDSFHTLDGMYLLLNGFQRVLNGQGARRQVITSG